MAARTMLAGNRTVQAGIRLDGHVVVGLTRDHVVKAVRWAEKDLTRLSSKALPLSAVARDGRPMTPLVV
jgi:hypothetical protein